MYYILYFLLKLFISFFYNEYFGENFKVYAASDFIAALTMHIPPAKVHLVRYYGLYSSRTKGVWNNMPDIVRLAQERWIRKKERQSDIKEDDDI